MSKILISNKKLPQHFILLMMSVFTVFIGYGIALPVLPFLLETRFGDQAGFSIAWHTGMMTGVFMFTLFLFAPLWGKLSDRFGRRPVILIGLTGCIITLLAFALVEILWVSYLTRAVGGAVVSAVLPVALAYVSDISSRELRSQHYAWMSAAATFGFLIGPGLGGWLSEAELSAAMLGVTVSAFPFLVAATFGSLVLVSVYFGLSESTEMTSQVPIDPIDAQYCDEEQSNSINSLLFLALLGMFGLGSFEVSLALQGQQLLNLTSFQIGMLFMECSLMMVLVQVFLFTTLVRKYSFTMIITSALLIMALGMAILPFGGTFEIIILATGLVGIGSGVLIPVLAYQTSIDAGVSQGAALGKQTAAGSFGQGVGSVLAGVLFGLASSVAFLFTAGLLVIGAFIGLKFSSNR